MLPIMSYICQCLASCTFPLYWRPRSNSGWSLTSFIFLVLIFGLVWHQLRLEYDCYLDKYFPLYEYSLDKLFMVWFWIRTFLHIYIYFCLGLCRSVMASSWTSAARLWRALLCLIFPACTGAQTCGARPRKDEITIAWVRKYQKEWPASLLQTQRSSSFACKVSQSLGKSFIHTCPGLSLKFLHNLQVSIYNKKISKSVFQLQLLAVLL